MIAGVCNAVGAITIGIAVSWFAANVLYDYHNPLSQGGYSGSANFGFVIKLNFV